MSVFANPDRNGISVYPISYLEISKEFRSIVEPSFFDAFKDILGRRRFEYSRVIVRGGKYITMIRHPSYTGFYSIEGKGTMARWKHKFFTTAGGEVDFYTGTSVPEQEIKLRRANLRSHHEYLSDMSVNPDKDGNAVLEFNLIWDRKKSILPWRKLL